ncbi:hypothetical protein JIG36_22895 [Actinoplanes sp. LDG1-06]|uniref:Uncharacterized protein n=1 Tax=Paractinoplanes ovalisporus TaxID=2810368 RepID=A0ABS2AF13_9ACTN|nr:hypothetical protein [Actinoplanes ovalisporus]MBM2618412.1 hypothetical protein [Actinoplanes ovalisporus]
MTVRARWSPGWYNLDQSLKVGDRGTFAFLRDLPPPGYDVMLANSVGTPTHHWNYWLATVESVHHSHFGALTEVDTRPFGQYTFTLTDGRWVTIEAEEGPGHVNAASPGFPRADCDPAWADTDGWALDVILTDVVPHPTDPAAPS